MNAESKRNYRTFVHKEAVLRIACDKYELITAEIIRQRRILEDYIHFHPEFQRSLVPVPVELDCPQIAAQMAKAAEDVGVGPMAAVAGAMAQMAAEAALKDGTYDVIVDNGGDIYMQLSTPAVIGIYSGPDHKTNALAFEIRPEDTPLSICSSSGKMGHSFSLGHCDLAVIVSKDAALADAAATLAANLVKTHDDIETALNTIMQIKSLDGALIIKGGRVGMAGKLPNLVKTQASIYPFYA
jgi:hypothetical protein